MSISIQAVCCCLVLLAGCPRNLDSNSSFGWCSQSCISMKYERTGICLLGHLMQLFQWTELKEKESFKSSNKLPQACSVVTSHQHLDISSSSNQNVSKLKNLWSSFQGADLTLGRWQRVTCFCVILPVKPECMEALTQFQKWNTSGVVY